MPSVRRLPVARVVSCSDTFQYQTPDCAGSLCFCFLQFEGSAVCSTLHLHLSPPRLRFSFTLILSSSLSLSYLQLHRSKTQIGMFAFTQLLLSIQ